MISPPPPRPSHHPRVFNSADDLIVLPDRLEPLRLLVLLQQGLLPRRRGHGCVWDLARGACAVCHYCGTRPVLRANLVDVVTDPTRRAHPCDCAAGCSLDRATTSYAWACTHRPAVSGRR
jgi:hypothetical protein